MKQENAKLISVTNTSTIVTSIKFSSFSTGSHIVGCSGFRLFASITALSAEGTYRSKLLLKFFDVRVIQEEVSISFFTVVACIFETNMCCCITSHLNGALTSDANVYDDS